MGYMEEVFSRAETMFSSDSAKRNWLSGFDKPSKNSYERDGVIVLRDFEKAEELNISYRRTEDVDDLLSIKDESTNLQFYGQDLPDKVDSKLTDIAITQEEEINRQISEYADRVDDIRSLPIEEQKELFRSGSREERDLAGIALGETSPQVLGGLISGESRRVKSALRNFF